MKVQAWLSEKRKENKVLCKACSQRCVLDVGEYGKCGIRKNEDGQLYLTVYGLAAAYNIDPVEKKPLYHFLPGTDILSVGTVGCNFSCKFCQNWEISQYPKEHNFEVFGVNLMPQTIVNIAKTQNIPSIAFTYNEPVVVFEYAYDTFKLAKEYGIKTVFVSSGYETKEALDTIRPYLDAANIDLKAFTDRFYREICGARLKPVLEAIEYAYKLGIWIEITTLIIPGENDSKEELRDIARFIASIDKDIPWHISRFYPMYKMTDHPPTPVSKLIEAYEIGKEEGLNYIYVGNIIDEDRESTYCPNCHFKVIERTGYVGQFVKNHLVDGKCPKCATPIKGVWK
ncbi:AmmeMemoRadiSam system radical SAM enzyme [Sulfurihydrogenibium azorense]|jgi:pyruvate formate lyase activating enzyme|uniref:AmmeMemoRadiSam system radical SAM enzyme n=1 Tax=Sulfurihydrogenibium azorense TaxID=309806 RepID=UPI00240952B0|nr:AmmeMemoRadiSam system radical SAM enzyme [Sulfurihydrogenibium azorense]MDM7273874.1 AmmeMemoRadiSam system radical SAM enzyme [Sulfurihydrogenibium azorense]